MPTLRSPEGKTYTTASDSEANELILGHGYRIVETPPEPGVGYEQTHRDDPDQTVLDVPDDEDLGWVDGTEDDPETHPEQ